MTGLLDPEAERDQPHGAAPARWPEWAIIAADFAGSVLLGAGAIWIGCVIFALVLAFIRWNVPQVPGLGYVRTALVASTMLEVWHRWRKAVGK